MKFCACGCGKQVSRTYVKGHNGRESIETRFWTKVTGGNIDSCWPWTGSTDSHGYGQIKVNGAPVKAHRFVWSLLRGDIPNGLTIDHLCYNTLCQNPWHMELVTPAENSRRVRSNQHKGKTHCYRGHEFTPDNTRILARGRRSCKTCERIRLHASRAAKRAKFPAGNPAGGSTAA